MRKICCIIGVIVVVIIGGISMCFSKNNYITMDGEFANLFCKYNKISETNSQNDMLTERKGVFAEEVDGYEKVDKFDDMEVVYNSNTLERIYIVVKNRDIRFGNKSIGIGDERSKIERVFRFSKQPNPPYDTFAYYDDSENTIITKTNVYCDDDYQISVGFEYDDNDKVDTIFIGYGPNN